MDAFDGIALAIAGIFGTDDWRCFEAEGWFGSIVGNASGGGRSKSSKYVLLCRRAPASSVAIGAGSSRKPKLKSTGLTPRRSSDCSRTADLGGTGLVT